MAAIRYLRYLLRVLATGLIATALLLANSRPAGANHGDIHAYCNGNQPVVKVRPPGTEHVTVTCVRGLPEFMVTPDPVPTYNPITQAMPRAVPPDFGGWVTVWLNGRPLVTPYDPVRRIQEPGAFVSASTSRVMMPVRFFTIAFGGRVDWSDEEKRARLFLKEKIVLIWLNDQHVFINSHVTELDQRPVLFQDRLFVPVRFLMEAYGAKVQWDHSNRSARIQMDGAQCVNKTYCGEVR